MKKHNSGAYKSLFFSLLTGIFLFFGFTQVSHASMDVDTFSAFQITPANFSGMFHAYAPLTHNGVEYWDYYVTPSTYNGNPAYNAILYNANGVYASGDGSTIFYTADSRGVYILQYDDTFSNPYGYTANADGNNCQPSGSGSERCYLITDQGLAGVPYLSQDIRLTDNCTPQQGWTSGTAMSPDEYLKCGSWDVGCSPVLTASSSCGGTTGGGGVVSATTCSASFSNIPSIIDDPWGFVSGVFSGVFQWFGCGLDAVVSSVQSFVNTATSSISSAISSGFDGLSTILQNVFVPDGQQINAQMDSIKSEFTTQFADIFTFYSSIKDASASTFQDRFSGNLAFRGHSIGMSVTPFNGIPSYVPIITSFVLFLELAWFLIHKIPELFG